MKTNPKDLTEEELSARRAALEAFDLEPFLDRLTEVLSADWNDNDIGGIAVDLVKAWMAVPCPHHENFYSENICLLGLAERLNEKIQKRVGIDRWTEVQLAIDEKYDPDDDCYQVMPPLLAVLSDFSWAYLPSYHPCYRDTARTSPRSREEFLDFTQASDEERARQRHRIELEKNCPYDPARVDEQKFADLLFLESLSSTCNDARNIARLPGLNLGRVIFDAYPECASDEEYGCVLIRVRDGVRNCMMREFADSKLRRMDRVSPMDLCAELCVWADTELSVLRRQNGRP